MSSLLSMCLSPASRQVPVEAALEAIRGRLVGTRLSLVTAAFSRLRGSGDAPPDAAAAVNVAVQFVPTGHPDVIAGRRSPEARKGGTWPCSVGSHVSRVRRSSCVSIEGNFRSLADLLEYIRRQIKRRC